MGLRILATILVLASTGALIAAIWGSPHKKGTLANEDAEKFDLGLVLVNGEPLSESNLALLRSIAASAQRWSNYYKAEARKLKVKEEALNNAGIPLDTYSDTSVKQAEKSAQLARAAQMLTAIDARFVEEAESVPPRSSNPQPTGTRE